MEIYLVGGAVRDKLLSLEVKDRDWVVVGGSPQEMEKLGYRAVGKDFPVFLHPDSHEEYALARTERKTAPGYSGFAFNAAPDVTLEEDLKRRDLTINAMAETADGTLIDPYHGAEDLRSGTLRHVSSAFAEDPVRILRVARFAARFAAWGFKVAHDTNTLMRKMVENGEVDALVAERVWVETRRALTTDKPSRFFEVLRGCDALAKVFPEIDALFGVPQPEHHHPEKDTGIHVMMVLDQAAQLSQDPQVRFAALTHDLGKATTPKKDWPRHIGHEQRSVVLIKELCQRLRVPKDYRELAMATAHYHTHCHRAAELKPSTLLKTLLALDAFRKPKRLEQFLLACEADARGRKGKEKDTYPQANIFRKALTAAQTVDASEIAATGLGGEKMKQELFRQRTEAIKDALSG
ncbi:MAG: multifunctional CCA addition/repair protein [Gammaproteobacteria bacterium]|nr:multifunctional CCA addition/repair protein [Gammaproteobacteria bacterium]